MHEPHVVVDEDAHLARVQVNHYTRTGGTPYLLIC